MMLVPTENELGWELGAMLGYDFGPVRAELEGAHKDFTADTFTSATAGVPRSLVLATGEVDGFGQNKLTSLMANLLLDFGGDDTVGFAVGGGFGHTWYDVDTGTTATSSYLDGDDKAWAWQAIAELRVPVTDSADVGLRYKYLNTNNYNFVDSVGRDTEYSLATHSALLTLMFNFGGDDPVVAPPPPPSSAPTASTTTASTATCACAIRARTSCSLNSMSRILRLRRRRS